MIMYFQSYSPTRQRLLLSCDPVYFKAQINKKHLVPLSFMSIEEKEQRSSNNPGNMSDVSSGRCVLITNLGTIYISSISVSHHLLSTC